MAKSFPNLPAAASAHCVAQGGLRFLHFWHLASLDAPTVAVVWALGFAWAAGVHLPDWTPLLVGLVVWAVYVADRLLDAHGDLVRGKTDRLQERHLFHWRHRRWLMPLAGLAAAAAGAILLGQVPAGVKERDSVLAAAALAYFTRVHVPHRLGDRWPAGHRLRGILSKELMVGVLFTAGCVLPAWSRAQTAVRLLAAPAIAFALLAWLNCALIDAWESSETDRRRFRAPALALAAGALLAAGIGTGNVRAALLLSAAAMAALLLAVLDAQTKRLHPVTQRALADLALLTPLLAFCLAAGVGR